MKALCLIILSFVTLMECGIVTPNQGKYANYYKALKKYERPKMKRDAWQKYGLFLKKRLHSCRVFFEKKDCVFAGHHFSFLAVLISLGLYLQSHRDQNLSHNLLRFFV